MQKQQEVTILYHQINPGFSVMKNSLIKAYHRLGMHVYGY